jgi:dienelactone hydrolase
MEIYTNCVCGRAFAAPPHLAGTHVACPYCGRYVLLPARFVRQVNPIPWIVGGLAAFFVLLLCGGLIGGIVWGVRSFGGGGALAVQTQDYAAARQTFRTNLLRRGPSPQPWDDHWDQSVLYPPDGAELTAFGGHNLTAIYDLPRLPGKRPVVIFLHGGFAFGDGDYEMAQPYRDAGFVVVMPILRGENGHSGDFTLYYDEVDDVLALVDALGRLEHVDTNNVFVAGHSAGGTLATLAALTSNRFRAAASLSGSMNQNIMLGDREYIPFDASDPREVQMRSPEAYAQSFKCPARLYYGDEEFLLSAAIERTAATAARSGLDVQAVAVPGDHFTSVEAAAQQSAAFFRQHVSSVPSFTPPAVVPPPVVDRPPPAYSPPTYTPPTYTPPIPVAPSIPDETPDSAVPIPAGRPIVVFGYFGYNGAGDRETAARQALANVLWADARTVYIDEAAGEMVIGLRSSIFATGEAKTALQSRGFELGGVSYFPNGRP